MDFLVQALRSSPELATFLGQLDSTRHPYATIGEYSGFLKEMRNESR